MYDDLDELKLNDVCEFVGMLSRVPGLAAAQLDAQRGGNVAVADEEGLQHGLVQSRSELDLYAAGPRDELAVDEALAMPPTSLVRDLSMSIPP